MKGTIMNQNSFDLRDEILRNIAHIEFTASILADDNGLVAETGTAAEEAKKLGLTVEFFLVAGSPVQWGDEVLRLRGSPKQIAMAEDLLLGIIAKSSGIATVVNRFMKNAGERPKIVSGAWKKMPPSLKETIRTAIQVGGGSFRISNEPFVYLDKNLIHMLGGIQASLLSVAHMTGHRKVVQIKGRHADIAQEAVEAASNGADIVFIDTGNPNDISKVSEQLKRLALRNAVKVAYAGNITFTDISMLKSMDVDIIDVGRSIIDAPLLDLRLEVTGRIMNV